MSNAIPEDLKGMYADALMDSSKPWFWAQILPSRIVALIERIAAAEAERNRLRVDLYELRDVVTAENFAEMQQRAEKAEAELVTARRTIHELQCELRQERGLKALLANGMPPTGNDDFDKVLATHPIAAMIQRGWLPGVTGFDDLPALESAICHFWAVKTIAECVNPPLIAARKDANDKEEA
jgi:hypothetical protein